MNIPESTARKEIQNHLRRLLKAKQQKLAMNTADRLDENEKAAQAMRRNEKSIALFTAKLLCPHNIIIMSAPRVNGIVKAQIRCPDCKTAIFLNYIG